jgi:hypothetical protein
MHIDLHILIIFTTIALKKHAMEIKKIINHIIWHEDEILLKARDIRKISTFLCF